MTEQVGYLKIVHHFPAVKDGSSARHLGMLAARLDTYGKVGERVKASTLRRTFAASSKSSRAGKAERMRGL